MNVISSLETRPHRRGRRAYCKSPQNSLPRRASNRLSNISFSYWIIRDFSFILLITKNIKNPELYRRSTQCLKIIEKVSFYIASYVYIFIKKAQTGQFVVKQCYQTGHFFNSTKIGGKCQNSNATF